MEPVAATATNMPLSAGCEVRGAVGWDGRRAGRAAHPHHPPALNARASSLPPQAAAAPAAEEQQQQLLGPASAEASAQPTAVKEQRTGVSPLPAPTPDGEDEPAAPRSAGARGRRGQWEG